MAAVVTFPPFRAPIVWILAFAAVFPPSELGFRRLRMGFFLNLVQDRVRLLGWNVMQFFDDVVLFARHRVSQQTEYQPGDQQVDRDQDEFEVEEGNEEAPTSLVAEDEEESVKTLRWHPDHGRVGLERREEQDQCDVRQTEQRDAAQRIGVGQMEFGTIPGVQEQPGSQRIGNHEQHFDGQQFLMDDPAGRGQEQEVEAFETAKGVTLDRQVQERRKEHH